MSRSHLRGLGLVTAAMLAASLFLGTPASAEGATGTIAGAITDGGAPVASASVQVSTADGSFYGFGYTDASGQYTVYDVPEAASAYRVQIFAPGHPSQYAHGVTSEQDAALFSVTGGQTTTVDEALLPTGTITGHLRDRNGNGVGGAWVAAENDEVGQAGGTNSDADGAYTLHVFAGTYRVAYYNGTYQYAYGTRDRASAAMFTVGVGESVTVDDTLLPTGSVAGTVTYADGSPASDVYVQLENNSGDTSSTAYTGPDGTYRIDNVVPGDDYVARFQLPSGAAEYAHHAFTRDQATVFSVVADETATMDEQLPATGVMAGRFTDQAGNGMSDVQVSASGVFPTQDSVYTSTGADGSFRIDRVFPGNYTVFFQNWQTNLQQYAYGKIHFDQADVITVTADQTTTVNDQQLPTGGLKVTAKDALTGAPIQNFFVDLGSRYGNTETGELVIGDLAVGQYSITAGADGYAYTPNAASATITAGNETVVELSLRPVGKITAKVVDRKTGQPVAGICVFTAQKTHFGLPDGCGAQSDESGTVTINVDNPGSYNLFALPDRGSVYGAQWVGSTGGTGRQDAAAKLLVKSGETTAAPKIKLDKAGTITGKATSENGQPLVRGIVGIVEPDYGAGSDHRYVSIGADGTYTVDYLGPYQWPLIFGAEGHAYQWSGGKGDRLKATLVAVSSRKTTKYNYQLKVGTDVTITDSSTTLGDNRYVLRNAVTGDVMGVVDGNPPPTHVRIIGPQDVKLQCYCGGPSSIWLGGTDFADATAVAIPGSGTKEIIFNTP
jgi:hypothetical protein